MPKVWKAKDYRPKSFCLSKGGGKKKGVVKKGWKLVKVGGTTKCLKTRSYRNCRRKKVRS